MTTHPTIHLRLDDATVAEVRALAAQLPRLPNGSANMSAAAKQLLSHGLDVHHGRSLGPFTRAGLAELDRLALEGEDRTATAKRLLAMAAGVIAAEHTRPRKP